MCVRVETCKKERDRRTRQREKNRVGVVPWPSRLSSARPVSRGLQLHTCESGLFKLISLIIHLTLINQKILEKRDIHREVHKWYIRVRNVSKGLKGSIRDTFKSMIVSNELNIRITLRNHTTLITIVIVFTRSRLGRQGNTPSGLGSGAAESPKVAPLNEIIIRVLWVL